MSDAKQVDEAEAAAWPSLHAAQGNREPGRPWKGEKGAQPSVSRQERHESDSQTQGHMFSLVGQTRHSGHSRVSSCAQVCCTAKHIPDTCIYAQEIEVSEEKQNKAAEEIKEEEARTWLEQTDSPIERRGRRTTRFPGGRWSPRG